MKQRIITGVIAFLILIVLIMIGKWALFAALLIVNAMAMFEYLTTISRKKDIPDIIFNILIGTGMIVVNAFYPKYLLTVLVLDIILVFTKDIMLKNTNTEKTIYTVWGSIYISFFISLAAGIVMGTHGVFILMMMLIACVACDTFAYFIGIRYGKHKLSPHISPKKSVEGSIAGFIAAVAICSIAGGLQIFFAQMQIQFSFFIFSGLILGVMAQFGDLAASMIKRQFDVKDYSNLLPGHGGILDRIDSQLFGFASMYIFIQMFLPMFLN